MQGYLASRRSKYTPILLDHLHLFFHKGRALKWIRRDAKSEGVSPVEKYTLFRVSSWEDPVKLDLAVEFDGQDGQATREE